VLRLANVVTPIRRPKKVLVLCTGNSCRSIMAEAMINSLSDGRYIARSAGSRPAGYVHPKALETLRRHGIDPGEPTSQSWDDFAAERFDCVITVCDSAAAETCPAFPGEFVRLHWSTPDPAQAVGDEAAIDAAFEEACTLLRSRVETELP
jgi:arsenate reductase